MPDKVATPLDVAVARVAADQHGVISATQLRALGMNREAISRRARLGRLHRIHRGVYAVGHSRLSNEGRWMAAVLTCGECAVLSHRSAAALWRLIAAHGTVVDVTVPGIGGRTAQPGIRLRRSRSLDQQETTRRANIPVTNPARTLADLRGCASPDELSRARRQAEFFGYRVDLSDPNPIERSRNVLERSFVRLCQRHYLPTPLVNASLCGYEVDSCGHT